MSDDISGYQGIILHPPYSDYHRVGNDGKGSRHSQWRDSCIGTEPQSASAFRMEGELAEVDSPTWSCQPNGWGSVRRSAAMMCGVPTVSP
jgi:hypothetical protein